ncbi:MAG TPA: c-type cytochrome [Labilithrix sp.]|nr:c-type cytochrome [Labilithrix sp.]
MLALVACKSRASSTATGDADAQATVAAAREGETLYQSLCAVCHGADARGYKADNAPSLVNATFLESATDEQLRRWIIEGRPGTSMAAYGTERGGPLETESVAQIVAWIRSHGPAPKAIPPRGIGHGARGAPLYAAHCERCHGSTEKRGTAVHLANVRFLDVASDAFLGWAIRQGRPGTPMESWQGKLTDGEIDDVVAYVRSLAKPPAPAMLPPPTGTEPVVLNPAGRPPTFTPRSTPCPPSTPCKPDARFVSVDQVKQALEAKRRMVIIDARPPSDWMRVRIPGAVSIPYHDLKRLDEVPNDGTWVIAYCACPHHLSGDVVDALRKRGVQHAVVLDEGILEWHRRGYPVVTAPGVERPLPAPSPGAGAPSDAGHR